MGKSYTKLTKFLLNHFSLNYFNAHCSRGWQKSSALFLFVLSTKLLNICNFKNFQPCGFCRPTYLWSGAMCTGVPIRVLQSTFKALETCNGGSPKSLRIVQYMHLTWRRLWCIILGYTKLDVPFGTDNQRTKHFIFFCKSAKLSLVKTQARF